MTGVFRSKSSGLIGLTHSNSPPPSGGFFNGSESQDAESTEEEEEEDETEVGDQSDIDDDGGRITRRPKSRLFIGAGRRGRNGSSSPKDNQFPILDMVLAVLRKSLIRCSVETDEVCSLDISWPTDVRHVSHVTFDRFNGFLGLPDELRPEVPRKAPSASASVFGVSAKSMQCSYDGRANSVPTILLMMQRRLYSEGGLTAEGIFRINADNSQEEHVRGQLNQGLVPHGIDVHCLAGLIKAWFRELPTGVLDSLTPEQVMHCNTEEDCTKLSELLPPMEAALLDWAINLMADVVQDQQFNKMNARNIAMVFAPNMTQMADPLTALIHAVQVMNFLKTLILKTLLEREESVNILSSCSDYSSNKTNSNLSSSEQSESCEQVLHACADKKAASATFLRSSTLSRLEAGPEEKLWSFHKSDEEDRWASVSGGGSPEVNKMSRPPPENESSRGECDSSDWLSLRKGVRKLCRHPVFQFNKPVKKTRSVGIVNTRAAGEEAWV